MPLPTTCLKGPTHNSWKFALVSSARRAFRVSGSKCLLRLWNSRLFPNSICSTNLSYLVKTVITGTESNSEPSSIREYQEPTRAKISIELHTQYLLHPSLERTDIFKQVYLDTKPAQHLHLVHSSDRGAVNIPDSMYLIPHIGHVLPSFQKIDHFLKVFILFMLEALTVVQNKSSVFAGYNLSIDIWHASTWMRHDLGKDKLQERILRRQGGDITAFSTPKHSLIREDFPTPLCNNKTIS